MKLPRDLSGDDVVNGLRRVGYEQTRQRGDHVTLTTQKNGEHHVTVPLHSPVKVGTLAAILDSVGSHLEIDRQKLIRAMKL
jgi:predicted RNA binding protein YcfA (HicA-like mRNA interferase family)